MSNKINTKCKYCRHCSAPSIIETKDSISVYNPIPYTLEVPKRKIVYRCELGINHTSIKSEVMLIDDESDYKCSSFSRK